MDSVKSREKRKYMRLWDFGVILLVGVVAAVGFMFFLPRAEDELVAVIRLDSEVFSVVEISANMSPRDVLMHVKDGDVLVRVTDSSAEIVSSPCPDKLCINTGKLTKSGQSAVCLPERVSVTIESKSDSSGGFDAIAG